MEILRAKTCIRRASCSCNAQRFHSCQCTRECHRSSSPGRRLLLPCGWRRAAGFAVLGPSRVLVIIALAAANQGTLDVNRAAASVLATLMLIPAVYLFYSVKRYFKFRRALGADHFDSSYRNMPLVREGIFRFTSNGMYTFGFFAVWLPGLYAASQTALLAAAFNHAYIWVHYYATELPDMRRIYGQEQIERT